MIHSDPETLLQKGATKEVTTVRETKMVLAIRRGDKESDELLGIDPQQSPVSFGTSESCNVVVPETESGTVLPKHFTIEHCHGSFFHAISKLAGLTPLDGIDDEANDDDRVANRRARDRACAQRKRA